MYTPTEAAETIASPDNNVEAIFFGMPWIAHPDLAKRIQYGKALDGPLDFLTLYGSGGSEEEEKKGYTDYSEAVY